MKKIDEIITEVEKEIKFNNEQTFIDNGYICIKIRPEENVGPVYEIPLSACNTSKNILEWIHHLCSKNWITSAIIESIICLACEYHNIDLWG